MPPRKQHCPACEDELDEARALVIKLSGAGAVFTPVLILLLSFIDAVLNKHSWIPDERILLAMLAAAGSIVAFAWRTRK